MTSSLKYATFYFIMDEITKLKAELERTKMELGILYEISNAMRSTLKLDEILYIILTGVTAHIGLGFNRAVLFLVNDKDLFIEGKMAIGPDTGEEAGRIWTQIEHEKMDLEELISAFQSSKQVGQSGFKREAQNMRIPLRDKDKSLLALVALEGMPLHLTRETMQSYKQDHIVQLFKSEEMALIPLKAKDKVIGIVVADNFITKDPITKNDIRMLTLLANQAGLAIEDSQLYEKTVLRAHTDSLTELWNHGYFQYLLQSELEKAKATQKPLTLVTLDIDDFKVYNDTLGHQAGDQILRDLANLLKDRSRKMDHVCRYGGEEFMMIMPQAEKKEAFQIAERLRETIKISPFSHEEILPSKHLTVSIGLATFPENASTPSELIAAADKALYEAKHKGKNSTCCAA